MAANTIVTSPRQPSPQPRGGRPVADPSARAAARTAPRGPGLAPVVALPVRRVDVTSGPAGVAGPAPSRPARPGVRQDEGVCTAALRVVPAPARRTRTLVRVTALLAAAAVSAAVVLGTVMAGAEEPVAAGHVVLQPGETLWDIVVRSAPAGVDPRRQLDAVRRLNGFGPGALDAWTVVLIPAP